MKKNKDKLGRNPRSDRDLCEKGNKSPRKKEKSKREIKVLFRLWKVNERIKKKSFLTKLRKRLP